MMGLNLYEPVFSSKGSDRAMTRYNQMIVLLLILFIPLMGTGQDQVGALIRAAQQGDTATMEALLAKGVDVNAKSEYGQTALMWAALFGHSTLIQLLLDKGADPNAKTPQNWTALMYAARDGHANHRSLDFPLRMPRSNVRST
jgi:ankyrin repeat protein